MGGLRAGTLEVAAEQATTWGTRGLVLAAAPLAAALGAETMRRGGNAFDGAVVAALAETVLLPPKCGLGGDLVAIVCSPRRSPEALIAVGPAPAGLAASAAKAGLETVGPRSVGVPGAPAGYAALAARARFSLDELTAPAIRLARSGFIWPQVCTALSRASIGLVRRHNPEGNRYFPDWSAIEPGTRVSLPGMANLLEAFATSGEGLFHGPLGKTVAGYVGERGGVLEAEDLASAEAEWSPAEEGELGGGRLWVTPAPTHGPALVGALQRLSQEGGQGAVWDAVVEAIRTRGQLTDLAGTSIVSAADGAGTVVTVIHSNSYPRFGSGLIVGEFDLILSNRAGRGFSPDPGHPNFPRAGRRPATTLHAWAFDQGGGRLVVGGTPGGDNQTSWNLQLLGQLLGGQHDPGMLVVAPRWEWRQGDEVVVEDGFSPEDEEALRQRASKMERVPRWGLASAQQVVIDLGDGRTVGAVDPRTGGAGVAV